MRAAVSIVLLSVCVAGFSLSAAAQEAIKYASLRARDGLASVRHRWRAGHRAPHGHQHPGKSPSGSGRPFRFPFLKIGTYEIAVRMQGCKTVTRSLTMNVGSAFQLPISLEIGGMETSVDVSR